MFAGSFLFAIYPLISCVNTINKTCHRVVKISYRGGTKKFRSFRQAASERLEEATPVTASPLCVLAFKLLKPPSYAGYLRQNMFWVKTVQSRLYKQNFSYLVIDMS